MCDFDNDYPATLWKNEVRRARKDYRCCSCGLSIQKGDQYEYHFDLSDGTVSTEHACLECGAANKIFHEEHGGGHSTWHLIQSLCDCIDGTGREDRKLGNIQLWRDLLSGLKMRRRKADRINKEKKYGKTNS